MPHVQRHDVIFETLRFKFILGFIFRETTRILQSFEKFDEINVNFLWKMSGKGQNKSLRRNQSNNSVVLAEDDDINTDLGRKRQKRSRSRTVSKERNSGEITEETMSPVRPAKISKTSKATAKVTPKKSKIEKIPAKQKSPRGENSQRPRNNEVSESRLDNEIDRGETPILEPISLPGPALRVQTNPEEDREFNTDEENEENYVSDDDSFAEESVPGRDFGESNLGDDQDQSSQNDIDDSEIEFNRVSDRRSGADNIEKYIQDQIDQRWKIKEKELEEKFKRDGTPGKERPESQGANNTRLKSSSDTTLYAPALNKTPVRGMIGQDNIMRNLLLYDNAVFAGHNRGDRTSQEKDRETYSGSSKDESKCEKHNKHKEDAESARSEADRIILEAEKFKASLASPKGRTQVINDNN